MSKQDLDKAYQDYNEAWEHDAHLDFDKALEEHRKAEAPVKITFNGKDFELPPSMPLSVWTFVNRHGDKQGNITDDKAYEFIELVLGKRFLKELDKSSADVSFVMNKVIPSITNKWQGAKKKLKQKGKQ